MLESTPTATFADYANILSLFLKENETNPEDKLEEALNEVNECIILDEINARCLHL